MGKNIDRELPVVTGLGTFLSIESMARLDTPLGHLFQHPACLILSKDPSWKGKIKIRRINIGLGVFMLKECLAG